jgi:hypothetical protein
MKKLLLFILIITGAGNTLFAQQPEAQPPKGEMIKKLFIYEMTQKLNLTTDEAQKFWPVFNQYEGEWRAAVKENKDDVIKRGEEILKAQKKYKPDFVRILSTEDRANRVFKVHGNFIDRLKNRIERQQERRQNNPPRPGNRGGRNI